MASVKLDPEGGYPNYSGPVPSQNSKQANDDPQAIPVDQPDANTTLPGRPLDPKELPR